MKNSRKDKRKFGGKRILYTVAALVLLLAAGAYFCLGYTLVNGKIYKRNTEVFIAQDALPSLEALSGLKQLRLVDLRGLNEVDDAYVAAAKENLPDDCELLWSVELSDGFFDSDSAALVLPSFSGDDVARLAYFEQLSSVDATGSSDYEALATAQSLYREIEFRYTLAVGDTILNNDDASLVVSGTPDLNALNSALKAFPKLTELDFCNAIVNYTEMNEFAEEHPGLSINWVLRIGELELDPKAQSVQFSGANFADDAEAIVVINCLKNLTSCNLIDSGLTPAEAESVALAIPGLAVRREIELCGLVFDSETESLDLRDATVDLSELQSRIGSFTKLTSLYLPEDAFSEEELAPIIADNPSLFISRRLEFCGQKVSTEITELDISGFLVESLDDFRAELRKFPMLNRLIMCDCGLSDLQMEELSGEFSNIRFVWTVKIGPHELRTDAVGFSTKNPTKHTSDKASDEYNELVRKTVRLYEGDIAALKYCTDLVALDLGHNYLTDSDLEVLQYLDKLQILILADNKITDISALANLHELVYVELFMNRIPDVSPLVGLEKLLDVNICNIGLSDLSPLYELTGVERLWFSMNDVSRSEAKKLTEALPNCLCNYTVQSATDDGWREHPRYSWMRSFFG